MLVLKILYWIIACLLILKIIANLSIPATLAKKEIIDEKTGKTGGVSLMLELDIFCLLFLLVISYFISEDFLYNLKSTAFFFGGGVFVSLLIAMVLTGIVGYFRAND